MKEGVFLTTYLVSLFFFFLAFIYGVFYKFQAGKAEGVLGIILPRPIKTLLIAGIALPVVFSLIVFFLMLDNLL